MESPSKGKDVMTNRFELKYNKSTIHKKTACITHKNDIELFAT